MNSKEFTNIVNEERTRVYNEQYEKVKNFTSKAEADIVDKIKKCPNSTVWKSYISKAQLEEYSHRSMFDIIKKFKHEFTDLEIVHESNINFPDQLYFQFKMD